MKYKTGLKHPKHTLQSAQKHLILASHLDQLGTPPSTSYPWAKAVEDVVGDDWKMFLNDRYGCCVIADDGHDVMIISANGSGKMVIPEDKDIEQVYHDITGFDPNDVQDTDNGTAPEDNLKYMEATGMCGFQYDAGGPVSMVNHRMWACHLFAGVRFCIQVPSFCEPDFEDKGIWDYTGQQYTIEGEHDIRGVQYEVVDGQVVWEIITWGRRIKMTESFYLKFGIMTEADICRALVTKSGLTAVGLNLDGMLQRLQQVR